MNARNFLVGCRLMEGQPAAAIRHFSSKEEQHPCHAHSHSGQVDLDTNSGHRGIWDSVVQTIRTHLDEHIAVAAAMSDVLDRGHWATLLSRVQKIRSQHGHACDGQVGKNQRIVI